uniref:Uncharacterized protein n=1 Tax=Oryza glumipatula TaxID=40148 RepID=A0A0E0BA49_9ORYZ
MNKRRFSAHSLILVTVLAVLIVLAMTTALLGLSIGRRALGDPHGVQSTAAMQQDAQALAYHCRPIPRVRLRLLSCHPRRQHLLPCFSATPSTPRKTCVRPWQSEPNPLARRGGGSALNYMWTGRTGAEVRRTTRALRQQARQWPIGSNASARRRWLATLGYRDADES